MTEKVMFHFEVTMESGRKYASTATEVPKDDAEGFVDQAKDFSKLSYLSIVKDYGLQLLHPDKIEAVDFFLEPVA